MMRSVASPARAAVGGPEGSANGSPNSTRTGRLRPSIARSAPSGPAKASVPVMATGTMGAPPGRASTAEPGRAGCSARDAERVPSGNTSTARPARRWLRPARSAPRSADQRRTGKAPNAHSVQPTSGSSNSSRLAITRSLRGVQAQTSTGSTLVRWLATTIAGPSRGTRSACSTSRREQRRIPSRTARTVIA